jgi:protein MAK11
MAKSQLEQHTRPSKRAKTEARPSQKRAKGSPHPLSSTKASSKAGPQAVDSTPSAKPSKDKGKAKTPDLPSSFNVIAGSYEKLLYGLHGTVTALPDGSEDYAFDLKPIFIFPAHVSCIKAVAASPSGGKWLATGSADEIIKVWDLRRRKEIGGLMHHEGKLYFLRLAQVICN